jgi:hypothetical protein
MAGSMRAGKKAEEEARLKNLNPDTIASGKKRRFVRRKSIWQR